MHASKERFCGNKHLTEKYRKQHYEGHKKRVVEARQGYKTLISKGMTANTVLTMGESLKFKSIQPKKIISRFANSSTSPGTLRRGKW